MNSFWGKLTTLDLKRCNYDIITSKEAIANYVIALCKLIEMERFGDVQIVNFGNNENVSGYSFMQFITTSSLSGHFANLTRNAYIDIFSCKDYDHYDVKEFSKDFFKADQIKFEIIYRE